VSDQGTDPLKEPEQPGWEGKAMGKAVADDLEQADRLLDDTGGDVQEAERQFDSGIDEVGETPVRPEDEPDTRHNAG
jgi:hypothetical protein